jgi:hypothetical protein
MKSSPAFHSADSLVNVGMPALQRRSHLTGLVKEVNAGHSAVHPGLALPARSIITTTKKAWARTLQKGRCWWRHICNCYAVRSSWKRPHMSIQPTKQETSKTGLVNKKILTIQFCCIRYVRAIAFPHQGSTPRCAGKMSMPLQQWQSYEAQAGSEVHCMPSMVTQQLDQQKATAKVRDAIQKMHKKIGTILLQIFAASSSQAQMVVKQISPAGWSILFDSGMAGRDCCCPLLPAFPTSTTQGIRCACSDGMAFHEMWPKCRST